MKLNVSDLKRFKANSASIKTNNVLPILSYLKFDKGTVTKNSMGSFITQKIDCDKSFLVDEKILMSLVECTSSPTISIELKDGKIIMSDGSIKKTSPSEPVENFPTNDEADSELFSIDREVLESIGIASQFVVDMEVPSPSCFVFVGKKHVCGSNGAIAYIDEFEEDLPEMVLDRTISQTISKYDTVKFSSNESYIFFETSDLKFGFIQPSHKFFDETSFADFTAEAKFIMDKSEFVNINDMVIKDTVSKIAQASIEVSKGKMFFEMNDTGYEVNTTKEFDVEGDVACDKFNFNPVLMNKLLKSVPDTELTFNKVGNRYYITGDSGFVALIIGMA
jgi:hypothetical protein